MVQIGQESVALTFVPILFFEFIRMQQESRSLSGRLTAACFPVVRLVPEDCQESAATVPYH